MCSNSEVSIPLTAKFSISISSAQVLAVVVVEVLLMLLTSSCMSDAECKIACLAMSPSSHTFLC